VFIYQRGETNQDHPYDTKTVIHQRTVPCATFTISYEAEVGAVGFGYQAGEKGIRFGSSFGIGSFLSISWG